MNQKVRTIAVIMALLMFGASFVFARSIIEKKMYYVDVNKKVVETKFWAIFLGTHDCTIKRTFPGEGEVTFDASINFQLLSSGYIEGNGYSAKGKVQSLPGMLMINDAGEHKVELDSIDYIYDWGTKVVLKNGQRGEFFINAEGTPKMAKKFLLREFKLVDYFGEKILKEGAEDVQIIAFSFTKEGAMRAAKEQISE